MLRTLRVQDLAIIEELELTLEPGLNVVTGETGAGKSILLQALDVALGGRPDADLVRTGAEEAVVEALFTDPPPGVRDALAAAGIGNAEDLVLRRVIAKGGRTRAYVNGSLGSLALLRELAPHLIRAYGQDEHHALRRVETHRELLDSVGGLGNALDEMRHRYGRLAAARDALAAARNARESAVERVEVLQSQLTELRRAELVPGEEDRLSNERTRLVHADRLASLVTTAEVDVYSGEGSVVEVLGRALASLRDAERVDAALAEPRRLIEAALAELEEAGSGLGRYLRTLKPDPERLERIEERLAYLARLQRKYGGTFADLVRRRDELAAEITAAEGGGEALAQHEAAHETTRRAAAEWAGRLSVERRRVARDLSRSLVNELALLALEGSRFTVRFGETEGRPLGPEGWDEVEFFLSTNAGEEPRSLARVASGGELSRIMLAVKSLAAQGDQGATLIFDEVDAGIGGAVAEVVGKKLRQLGRNRQVLCITHLPLIAAFAEHHVAVVKHVEGGRTLSTARALTTTERVAELARMLGGATLTPEVRDHAEQLLRQASGKGPRPGLPPTLTDRAGVE
jgi:DNA repair protein RecN (Recombination protein N)